MPGPGWGLASDGLVTVMVMVAVEEEEAEGVSGLQCCDRSHTQVPTPPSWFLGNIIAGTFLWPTQ